MNLKKLQQQEQKKVDDWNSKYQVGQKVIVTKDNGDKIETVTTNEATLLGGHTAVGWFKDISGAYSLDRAQAI